MKNNVTIRENGITITASKVGDQYEIMLPDYRSFHLTEKQLTQAKEALDKKLPTYNEIVNKAKQH